MSIGKPCKLALADGLVFSGLAFGAEGTTTGEVVFNTGLTGYQEALTDPSYAGQILTMTYPLIGNYGVNTEDIEAYDRKVQVRAFVIKELSPCVSNFRADISLDEYLRAAGVMGIAGVDTRALTRHLRTYGSQNGVMSTETLDDVALVRAAAALPSMAGQDLVPLVTPKASYDWPDGYSSKFAQGHRDHGDRVFNVVAVDCGAKLNILRNLVECGCKVRVVPASATAEEILSYKP
ncbi:MAG: carbamoyl phosphate synthase small subunit, partial [Planctomycetaceae bacterium]